MRRGAERASGRLRQSWLASRARWRRARECCTYTRMTFLQKLMILTVLAVVIALARLTQTRPVVASPARLRSSLGGSVVLWLTVIAGALIIVGIVSHTLLRHFVQVVPLLIAIGLSFRRPVLAVQAAAPLFAFWVLVMASIWLFLLGMARIFTGTFTPIEIALTVVIGTAALLGLLSSSLGGHRALTAARLGIVVGFAVLQFAAMWISVQPFVARR